MSLCFAPLINTILAIAAKPRLLYLRHRGVVGAKEIIRKQGLPLIYLLVYTFGFSFANLISLTEVKVEDLIEGVLGILQDAIIGFFILLIWSLHVLLIALLVF